MALISAYILRHRATNTTNNAAITSQTALHQSINTTHPVRPSLPTMCDAVTLSVHSVLRPSRSRSLPHQSGLYIRAEAQTWALHTNKHLLQTERRRCRLYSIYITRK